MSPREEGTEQVLVNPPRFPALRALPGSEGSEHGAQGTSLDQALVAPGLTDSQGEEGG